MPGLVVEVVDVERCNFAVALPAAAVDLRDDKGLTASADRERLRSLPCGGRLKDEGSRRHGWIVPKPVVGLGRVRSITLAYENNESCTGSSAGSISPSPLLRTLFTARPTRC